MMHNLARQWDSDSDSESGCVPPTEQLVATVVGSVGPVLRLSSAAGELLAKRAASCLLEPVIGDEVLVVRHSSRVHVLAVLERAAGQMARWSTEGDLEIAAAAGRVALRGRDGVEVSTAADATIAAGELSVHAARGDVVVGALAYLGERVTARVSHVKTVAETMETVATRWLQRLERAYRFIARSELVRAEYIELEARSALQIKAEATVVNSAGVTKIDGSQIHLG